MSMGLIGKGETCFPFSPYCLIPDFFLRKIVFDMMDLSLEFSTLQNFRENHGNDV